MPTRYASAAAFAVALATLAPTPAPGEAPMSAIDWLSRSIEASQGAPAPDAAAQGPAADGGPLAPGIEFGEISVSPISGPTADAIGLMSAARSGLPRDFWGEADATRLAEEVRALNTDTLPALREVIFILLLTEFAPPAGTGGQGALFLARIDKLLDFGALDQALALIELVGSDEPEMFRRWFDIALLTGREQAACEALRTRPRLEPSYPARIYCLARGGDWSAAVLTLRSADALEFLSPTEEEMLARFLDPDLFEGEPPMPALARPSPLMWRMQEAIGDPIPTRTLPVAFAQADLRSTAGWKAQIEAAERLSRNGALTPNRLLGLYTERRPAASGGVWERVAAVQRLDEALTRGDAQAVAAALPDTWSLMAESDLELVLSRIYAERLLRLPLTGEARALAFRAGLLADSHAELTRNLEPADDFEAFLIALASGDVTDRTPPADPLAAAIHAGFSDAPEQTEANGEDGAAPQAPGLMVLHAIRRLDAGAEGELRGITEGLKILRQIGLDEAARRTALQLLLLDRRG